MIQTIAAVAEGGLDICDSSNYRQLSLLQEHVPVLAAFLAKCPVEDDGKLPQDVRDLIKLLLQLVQAPFQGGPPTPDLYPPATDDPLSFFPCYQSVMEMRAMKLTRNCTRFRLMAVGKLHMVTQHSLRAYSRYTVSMECATGLRCESPKHPFQIFKTRFPRPPLLIIYDNACRLHVYCLNREPHFFENTLL